jgi:hypothetical protein
MSKYVLKRPITFDGREIKEINLNLDDLGYNDLRRAEKEARLMCGKKERLSMPKEFDTKYTSCLLAIAAGETVELIQSLKAVDFTAINMQMSDFLLGGDWDEDTEETEETTTPTKKIAKTESTTTA